MSHEVIDTWMYHSGHGPVDARHPATLPSAPIAAPAAARPVAERRIVGIRGMVERSTEVGRVGCALPLGGGPGHRQDGKAVERLCSYTVPVARRTQDEASGRREPRPSAKP